MGKINTGFYIFLLFNLLYFSIIIKQMHKK